MGALLPALPRAISYPVPHGSSGRYRVTRFLARRLLNYLVLLALASFLTFTLTSLTFAPLNSLLQRNPRPPQAVIDAKAAELDLDKPIPLRYGHWVSGAVRGDFGTTVNGQPVSDELWRRIGVSLRLLVIGSVFGTVIGVVVGAWGAVGLVLGLPLALSGARLLDQLRVEGDRFRFACGASGELDFVYTIPPQDMERIARTQGLKLVQGPELRTIYLGFDQLRPE